MQAKLRSAYTPLQSVSFTACSVGSSNGEPRYDDVAERARQTDASVASSAAAVRTPTQPTPPRCENPTPPSSTGHPAPSQDRGRVTSVLRAGVLPPRGVPGALSSPRGPLPPIPRHQPPRHGHDGPSEWEDDRLARRAETSTTMSSNGELLPRGGGSTIDESLTLLRQMDDSMTDLCDMLPKTTSATAPSSVVVADICERLDAIARVVIRHDKLFEAVLLRTPRDPLADEPRYATCGSGEVEAVVRNIIGKTEAVSQFIQEEEEALGDDAVSAAADTNTSSAAVNLALGRVADVLQTLATRVAQQGASIDRLHDVTNASLRLSGLAATSTPSALSRSAQSSKGVLLQPADEFDGVSGDGIAALRKMEFATPLGRYLQFAPQQQDDEKSDSVCSFIEPDERSPARDRVAREDRRTDRSSGYIPVDERSPARDRRPMTATPTKYDTASGFIPTDERSPPRNRSSATGSDTDVDGVVEADERSPARERFQMAAQTGRIAVNEQSPARVRPAHPRALVARDLADEVPAAHGFVMRDADELAEERYEQLAASVRRLRRAPNTTTTSTPSSSRHSDRREPSPFNEDAPYDYVEDAITAPRASHMAAALPGTSAKLFYSPKESATNFGDAPKPLYYATPVASAQKKKTSRTLFSPDAHFSAWGQQAMRLSEESDDASSTLSATTATTQSTARRFSSSTTKAADATIYQRAQTVSLLAENVSLKEQLAQQINLNERLLSESSSRGSRVRLW